MSKRILVLADLPTHPIGGGNQQCIMQYVDTLQKLGFEVYFLLVKEYGMDNRAIEETRKYWADHYFEYDTPWLQIQVQRVIRKLKHDAYPDILDFMYPWGLNNYINKIQEEYHFSGMIVNYIWMSKTAKCNIPTKVLFTHDIFTDRRKNIPSQYWFSFSKKNEAKALSRFENVFAIQDEERDFFKQLAPNSNVVSVYSPFEFVEQPITGNKNILFFSGGGKLNQDGINRFIKEVWPLLKSKDNEIKLLLGGNICSCFKKEELPEDIILKGRYENPDDFYALGDICINPVFSGSGLKIKTFEALAHGKVVIVDPHSALGVYKPESIPLYRTITAPEYVDLIVQFMCNKEALENKREQCRLYIQELNEYILEQYNKVFK